MKVLLVCSALRDAVEALSSGQAVERPGPQLTILQDYEQILERYDDYEEDAGELKAENTLAEKFSTFISVNLDIIHTLEQLEYIHIPAFLFPSRLQYV